MMVLRLHPKYTNVRAIDMPDSPTYVMVPHMSIRATYPIGELMSLVSQAKLARVANRMEGK